MSAKVSRRPMSRGAMPGPKARTGTCSRVVVGSPPGRVVAVVGGDHDEVARRQRGLDLGYPRVEGLEAGGVARDVATVAELLVEIDEVGEDEPAVGQPREGGQRRVEIGGIAVALSPPRRWRGARRCRRSCPPRRRRALLGSAREERGPPAGRRGVVLAGCRCATKPVSGEPRKGRAMTRPTL